MRIFIQLVTTAAPIIAFGFACSDVLGNLISEKQRKICFNIGVLLMLLHSVYLIVYC